MRRGIENLRIAGNFYGKPETNALFVIASSVINMSIVQRTPLKASQPSRWRPWLNENGSKLLLFARQQTRSLADAEDVLQEAVVKLARKVEEGTKLRDSGHSLVVVEHNLDVIAACDHLIDLGPGGGDLGGRLVASGAPAEVMKIADSATGRALREERN